MEVILLEDVPHQGPVGSLVTVKPGHARNYLLPRGLAVVANRKNKAQLDHQQRQANFRRAKLEAATQALAQRLESLVLTLPRKAGEQNKLFGSVTRQDLQQALAIRQIELSRDKIELHEPIRQLGEYEVDIRLSHAIKRRIKVMVVQEP